MNEYKTLPRRASASSMKPLVTSSTPNTSVGIPFTFLWKMLLTIPSTQRRTPPVATTFQSKKERKLLSLHKNTRQYQSGQTPSFILYLHKSAQSKTSDAKSLPSEKNFTQY